MAVLSVHMFDYLFICMSVCHTFLIFKKEDSILQILICLIQQAYITLFTVLDGYKGGNTNNNISNIFLDSLLQEWLFMYTL